MFFRQKYELYCFYPKKSKTGGSSGGTPPCFFQLHRKNKKNSILIQNTYTFVGIHLKVIEIFTKN